MITFIMSDDEDEDFFMELDLDLDSDLENTNAGEEGEDHYLLENVRPPSPDHHPSVSLTNTDIPQTPFEIEEGWTVADNETQQDALSFHFEAPSEPLSMKHAGREPIDFFDAFFDQTTWMSIKDETNRYARVRKGLLGDATERTEHPEFRRRARLNSWVDMTLGELKVFVAHLIIMGLVRKPDIEMYWSGAAFTKTPFFGVYLSRDRFQNILSNLHICDDTENPAPGQTSDNGRKKHDPLAKIRSFIDMMDRNFLQVYKPLQDISIDEGSMPWKGRLKFKQYNPSKPARFHVKLFQVCEAKSSYIVGFKVFTGTGSCHRDDPDITSDMDATTTTKTVMTLLTDSDILRKGHHVYMDNYYNSPALLEELLERETLGCGTVRKNRKGLPQSLVRANLKNAGDACVRRKPFEQLPSGGLLCVKWVDKRAVTMLSTIHGATSSWTGKYKRDAEKTPIFKPTVIVDYTRLMGGVDLSDQLMNYYNFLRRTRKWWRKMWVHLLNMIIHNAYVLNRKFGSQKKMSHYDFRESIALELIRESRPVQALESVNDYIPPELVPGRLAGRHFLEKIPHVTGRRVIPKGCKVCKISLKDQKSGKGQKKMKYTSFQCDQCKMPMCPVPCFKIYHTEQDYFAVLDSIVD